MSQTSLAAERDVRLRFLEIDDQTRSLLREFKSVLERHIDTILDGFYGHVLANAGLAKIIGGNQNVGRLKGAQKNHWLTLFEARFDDAYLEQVNRVGHAHHRIGLEPRWYMGGYCFALSRMIDVARGHAGWRAAKLAETIKAINRAVFLDMDLAISVYQDAVLVEREKRQKTMDSAIGSFDSSVNQVLTVLGSATGQMKSAAQTMTVSAEEASQRSTAVASASEEASTNVQTVAAAAEELSASITEISRQITQSGKIASRAVEEATHTNTVIEGMAEAAQKIGEVVKLINDIAGQTNLLALNATIEAARAGDAGKGFAVVASEVKSLATQTAKATEDIAAQINAMQSATKGAVDAIKGIGATIGEIHQTATAIAAAIEEQGAATQEITRNVQQAAVGTNEVSSNIAGVNQAASQTGTAATQVLASATELASQSDNLRGEVERFFQAIRAA